MVSIDTGALQQPATASALAAEAPAVLASAPAPIIVTGRDAAAKRLADARWCTDPPDAQTLALEAQADAASSWRGVEHFEKLKATPRGQRIERATEATRAAWASSLVARGDERSLAAADFLLSRTQGVQASAASARLTARARHSKDGFVMALALQRCQFAAQAGCHDLIPQRWAQADPGNLQPWLMEASRADRAGDGQALAEAVYQVGQATSSECYRTILHRMVLALPQSDQAGLQMQVEMGELVGVGFGGALVTAGAVRKWCAAAPQDANRIQSCAQAAEQLWTHADNAIDAILAVKIAALLPQSGKVWQAREQTLLAARQLERGESGALMGSLATAACGGIEPMKQMLVERLSGSEWQGMQDRLRRSVKPEAQLAAEWRAENPPDPTNPPPVTRP